MKKEKRPINPGDRVRWWVGRNLFEGRVSEVYQFCSPETFKVGEHEVNRRQIVRVWRKKKKREPRMIYFNTVGAGLSLNYFTDKELAKACLLKGERCVKFVEEIE